MNSNLTERFKKKIKGCSFLMFKKYIYIFIRSEFLFSNKNNIDIFLFNFMYKFKLIVLVHISYFFFFCLLNVFALQRVCSIFFFSSSEFPLSCMGGGVGRCKGGCRWDKYLFPLLSI